MARVDIDGHIVLKYEFVGHEHYWKQMSDLIIAKHGNKEFTDHIEVADILLDCLRFLADKIKEEIHAEKTISFFLYVFWLHEESIKLMVKMSEGYKLHTISEGEFAGYRRVLKLILETGCDIELQWSKFPTPADVARHDAKMQKLLYLGEWLYSFAEYDAVQKMVADCKKITFTDDGLLEVGWQHHFGQVYEHMMTEVKSDYVYAMFDKNAREELVKAIENCFQVDFTEVLGIIGAVKHHHSPNNIFQTVEPYVLPANLQAHAGITEDKAKALYAGLSISKTNKQKIEDTVMKPYLMARHFFRPILIYKIDGVDRALVGEEKMGESIFVLSTNAIHWNVLPKEWKNVDCMKAFLQKKSNEHDKLLEDKIQEILDKHPYLILRNCTKLRKTDGTFVDFEATCGEIDFIVINEKTKTIFVTDGKYNRARYDAVGFRNEYSIFKDEYEPKLKKKLDWINENRELLAGHLNNLYGRNDLDFSGFSIEAAFLINTPTFYMFNGAYKAVPLNKVDDYFEDRYEYPVFIIDKKDGSTLIAQHPYFVKPIQLDFF